MPLENPYTTTGPANTPPTLGQVAAAVSEHRDAPLDTPEGRAVRRELSALLRTARSTYPATALAAASGVDGAELARLTRDVLPEAAVTALLEMRTKGADSFGAGLRAAAAAGWPIADLAAQLGVSVGAIVYARKQGEGTGHVEGLRERRRPPAQPGLRIAEERR